MRMCTGMCVCARARVCVSACAHAHTEPVLVETNELHFN